MIQEQYCIIYDTKTKFCLPPPDCKTNAKTSTVVFGKVCNATEPSKAFSNMCEYSFSSTPYQIKTLSHWLCPIIPLWNINVLTREAATWPALPRTGPANDPKLTWQFRRPTSLYASAFLLSLGPNLCSISMRYVVYFLFQCPIICRQSQKCHVTII